MDNNEDKGERKKDTASPMDDSGVGRGRKRLAKKGGLGLNKDGWCLYEESKEKSVKEKQQKLDVLQQGLIMNDSKKESVILAKEIDRLREMNDIYYQQHFIVEWKVKGDRNTGYFHAVTVQRHKASFITALWDENGVSFLGMNFTVEDVKKGPFSMKKGKAPGPDGMPANFYQFYWNIVQEDITAMVLNCMNKGRFLKKFNFTFITLILKVANATKITQFRPIALCNTIAKLIAKVLVERLKKVLVTIVPESQSALVPNRFITDNILLAYEVHHFIKLRKTGGKYSEICSYLQPKYKYQYQSRILEMQEVTTHGTYLDLPSTISTIKKEVFSSIVGRIKSRIENWKPRLLSKLTTGGALWKTIEKYIGCLLIHSVRQNQKGAWGYRDTHAFNIALLSKEAWRIASDPSSQIALTYKAKYSPNNNFWNAKLGQNLSLTWRSILTARDLLEKGAKWSIGNGKIIQVWKHRWVPHTNSNKLIIPMNSDFPELRVSDLIDQEIGIWKIHVVRNLFFNVDADSILSMPLPNLHRKDTFTWNVGTDIRFTVKTAY
ncbi:hypothetical protein LIER_26064 [Lithospermum erythrorhizon]|uniref:Reverse transcriptase n=1 Tax=Lithospermum erythrorhizon TaxID=34254 RepID=A0AAV3R7B9_LITER